MLIWDEMVWCLDGLQVEETSKVNVTVYWNLWNMGSEEFLNKALEMRNAHNDETQDKWSMEVDESLAHGR